MIEVRAAPAAEDDLDASAALLAAVFPHAPRLDRATLAWSHLESPLGPSLLATARDDGRLVAQLAGRRLRAGLGSPEPRLGILVHHAATDPGWRRRGLLVQLIEALLGAAGDAGAAFAIAVVNGNSVDAFVRKAGFAALGPLDVRIACGGPPPRPRQAQPLAFEPVHDDAWLAWRLAAPGAGYSVRRRDAPARCEVWADSGIAGMPVLLGETPPAAAALALPARRGPLLAHAWVGLDPLRRHRAPRAIGVPLRLRPSPLHFVHRALAPGLAPPDRAASRFDALDFDAW